MFDTIQDYLAAVRNVTAEMKELTEAVRGQRYGDACRSGGRVLVAVAPVADRLSPAPRAVPEGVAAAPVMAALRADVAAALADPSVALAVRELTAAADELRAEAAKFGLTDLVTIAGLAVELFKLWREFRGRR
jgi:hypothetical protein